MINASNFSARRRGNNEGSIFKRKDGRWVGEVSLNGRRLTKYAKTQKECRDWVNETLGKIDFENLQGEKHYSGMEAYGRSKLANLLFTYELARRLEGTHVTVNAVHPGFVTTGFARNNGPMYNIGIWIASQIFGRKPDRGARTSIYLASSPEVEGVSGRYFVDCKAVDSKPQSYDRAAAEKLWQVSLELTGKASAKA